MLCSVQPEAILLEKERSRASGLFLRTSGLTPPKHKNRRVLSKQLQTRPWRQRAFWDFRHLFTLINISLRTWEGQDEQKWREALWCFSSKRNEPEVVRVRSRIQSAEVENGEESSIRKSDTRFLPWQSSKEEAPGLLENTIPKHLNNIRHSGKLPVMRQRCTITSCSRPPPPEKGCVRVMSWTRGSLTGHLGPNSRWPSLANTKKRL